MISFNECVFRIRPKIDSVDIDNYDDLEMAESVIFHRKEKR